jgi:hypothetical protein
MAEPGGFINNYLSSVIFGIPRAGISFLRVLAVENAFQLSATNNETGDGIFLYYHQASDGGGHQNREKTGCEMRTQLLGCVGNFRRNGRRDYDSNDRMI